MDARTVSQVSPKLTHLSVSTVADSKGSKPSFLSRSRPHWSKGKTAEQRNREVTATTQSFSSSQGSDHLFAFDELPLSSVGTVKLPTTSTRIDSRTAVSVHHSEKAGVPRGSSSGNTPEDDLINQLVRRIVERVCQSDDELCCLYG